MNDIVLVDRVRACESEAITALYDKYAAQVFSYCRSMLRHDHDAADATQDTFVRAIERIGQLRDPAKLRPWLFSIARHEAAGQGRRRARLRPTDRESVIGVDSPNMIEALSQAELAGLVQAAAEGLNERDQAILRMHLAAGMHTSEIAAALDVSVEHARVLMSRMRERLGRSMACLLLARDGADGCGGLGETLHGWDGRLTVRMRERISRHTAGCADCRSRSSSLLTPSKLLPAGLIAAAPVLLRSRTVRAMVAASKARPRGLGLMLVGRGIGAVLVGGAAAATAVVAAASVTPPGDPIGPAGPGGAGETPPAVVGSPAADDPRSTRSADDGAAPDGSVPATLVVHVGDDDRPGDGIRRIAAADDAASDGTGEETAAGTGGDAPAGGACGLIDLNVGAVDDLVAALPGIPHGVIDSIVSLRPLSSLLDVVDAVTTDQLGTLLSAGACVEPPAGTPTGGSCDAVIDLNLATPIELDSVLGLADGLIDRLLAARPLSSLSDVVDQIGLDPVQLASDLVAGTVCLGPAPDAGEPATPDGDAPGDVGGVVDGLVGDVGGVVGDVGDVVDGLVGDVGGVVEDLVGDVGGVVDGVGGVVDGVASPVTSGSGPGTGGAPPVSGPPVSSLVDGVGGLVEGVGDVVDGVVGGVGGPLLSGPATSTSPQTPAPVPLLDGTIGAVGDLLSTLTDPLVPTPTSSPGGPLGGLVGLLGG